MKKIKKYIEEFNKKSSVWGHSHYVRLAIFNTLLFLLVLLRIAGYFHPFFIVTVNVVVMVALIAAVILLDARSKTMFFVALITWLFAAFLRIVKIEVWAERTAVYTFQALVIGTILLIYETVRSKK